MTKSGRNERVATPTGDAAGQNMTGKATFVACEWIKANHPAKPDYILSRSCERMNSWKWIIPSSIGDW